MRLCRQVSHPVVHLLTYAAPVTNQMMFHFNDLDYFAMPALPSKWSAPMWLKIQLGIIAGRLYFPFSELGPIKSFLGLEEDKSSYEGSANNFESMISENSDRDGHISGQDVEPTLVMYPNQGGREKARLITNTLNFLHDWITMRGQNLDFTHTPMGYVCSGKLLAENHSFFRRSVGATEREAYAKRERAKPQEGTQVDDEVSDIDELDERQKLTEEELTKLRCEESDDSEGSGNLLDEEGRYSSSSNGD